MEILRTPDHRFAELPGYPYPPRYAEVEGLRIHYVEAGPREGPTVLLMHGEPSWSYLYRHMIAIMAEAGCRVIAPDLIGFGRSDKPARREDYTYERHVAWMEGFMLALDLKGITLVCQDWGGLIGLRLVAAHAERFDRVVAANTFLPTGEGEPSSAFLAWRRFAADSPSFLAHQILQRGTRSVLGQRTLAAYEAPFPSEAYLAGARQFPLLVPIRPEDPGAADNRKAWQELSRFEKPFLTAFSDGDRITAGLDEVFQKRIPGAANAPHRTIRGGGHFLQEDRGPELASVVLAAIG